jgi:dipeptidyl aminopeptidase/acylaminoacyl peptidase
MRTRATLALTALLVCAGLAFVAVRNYRSSHDLIEPAQASPLLAHPERTGVAKLTNVAFTTAEGVRLAGWYVPSRNRAALVVTHGTNGDRAGMLPQVRLLAEAGFGVLAFDWPGLGASEGAIRWDDGARQALTAALDWLSRRSDVDPQKIGGLGFSMGGLIMTRLAAHDPRLRALVLEGTPSSVDEYMRIHHGRWGIVGLWPAYAAVRHSGLLDPELAPERLIGRIAPRPLLLIGGTLDTEIPPAMVQQLFAAAHDPKTLWIVPSAQHGEYAAAAPAEYRRRVLAFFTAALRPAAAP